MAAQTRPYSSLLGRVEALMGGDFGDTEKERLEELANLVAEEAYAETDLWENFLVIGEERGVNDLTATVPYTGAVVDAGHTNPYEGEVDTFFRTHRQKPWIRDSVQEYKFQLNGTGAKLVAHTSTYGLSTTPTSAFTLSGLVTVIMTSLVDFYVGSTAQLDGFETGTGIPDINGTQTLTSVVYSATTTTIQFNITDTASYTLSLSGDEAVKAPVAFCSYKKRLSDTYGENNTTSVPREWFNYMVYAAYSRMLGADGQHDSALIEDQRAMKFLNQQLERLGNSDTAETIFNRISTHGTEQGRQTTYQ